MIPPRREQTNLTQNHVTTLRRNVGILASWCTEKGVRRHEHHLPCIHCLFLCFHQKTVFCVKNGNVITQTISIGLDVREERPKLLYESRPRKVHQKLYCFLFSSQRRQVLGGSKVFRHEREKHRQENSWMTRMTTTNPERKNHHLITSTAAFVFFPSLARRDMKQ